VVLIGPLQTRRPMRGLPVAWLEIFAP
jgi:hypothetical protein